MKAKKLDMQNVMGAEASIHMVIGQLTERGAVFV